MRLLPDLCLRAPGLQLRPWQSEDRDALCAAVRASMSELSAWFDWCRPDYAEADAEAFIRFSQQAWSVGSEYPFALLTEEGRLLGSIGVNHINRVHRMANLGYWISTPERGRGYTTRAADLLCRHVFAHLPLCRIEVVALPENLASRRVAEKLGARFECEARNRLFALGQSRTACVYALTPDDLAGAAVA